MQKYRGKYRKKTKSRPFFWVGIWCCLVAAVCLGYVGWFLLSGAKTKQESRRTAEAYVSAPSAQVYGSAPSVESADLPTEAPETATAQAAQTEILPSQEPQKKSPVDFEDLWEKNEAVVAWLRIPALEIVDYPVVLGPDNAYYTTHSWDDQESETGAVFLDYRNKGDFSQVHNILYAHCMKDGTMFQSLGKWEKQSFWESQDRTVLLYLPDKTCVYEIFAVERVNALDDRVYRTDDTPGEAWAAALEQTRKASQHSSALELTGNSRVLTLSTCMGDMDRLAIHAVCVEEETF